MTCQRCGATVPPERDKWCSENCRKRAWDDANRLQCARCGVPLPPNSGRAARRAGEHEPNCRACDVASRRAGHEAQLDDIQAMWEQGMLVKHIAATLGYGPKSVPPQLTELRRLGRIGYRYPAYERRAA